MKASNNMEEGARLNFKGKRGSNITFLAPPQCNMGQGGPSVTPWSSGCYSTGLFTKKACLPSFPSHPCGLMSLRDIFFLWFYSSSIPSFWSFLECQNRYYNSFIQIHPDPTCSCPVMQNCESPQHSILY